MENTRTKLNPRQEVFLRKHIIEAKPQTVAYQEAYNVKDDNVAGAAASRLLDNVKVKEVAKAMVADLAPMFKEDALMAYNVTKALINDPMTPAQTRLAGAKDIMDRAGYSPTTKVEQTIEKKYPELDNMTTEQLKGILEQVEHTTEHI